MPEDNNDKSGIEVVGIILAIIGYGAVIWIASQVVQWIGSW